jgi:MFS family permease
MNSATFRLVLLVSCAHALVHVYELSLPSVEQMIGDEFSVGRDVSGMLGTAWRLPFGMGALLAGWLADRYGSKRMLLIYLLGCAATCILAWYSTSLGLVFAAMFSMGCFASIYHPAGLALISRATTPENRGAALGWHGIFGSIGIASAPFLAGIIFSTGQVSWHQYYLILAIPAVLLAVLLHSRLPDDRITSPTKPAAENDQGDGERMQWSSYFLLVTVGALHGFMYGAFMHFLQRYLDEAGLTPEGMKPESWRNYLAALVLVCGVVGQAVAGRMARPGRLELQLTGILFANAPLLAWMAFAQGGARLGATCLLALVHFMVQPVYNSLIAQYVPSSHRSTGYGFNSMIGFGIGALAPMYAGFTPDDNWTFWTYGLLSCTALVGGMLSLVLWGRSTSHKPA